MDSFRQSCNEEIVYNNLTMNSQKIGVTTRSMSKGNEFLISKPAGASDKSACSNEINFRTTKPV